MLRLCRSCSCRVEKTIELAVYLQGHALRGCTTTGRNKSLSHGHVSRICLTTTRSGGKVSSTAHIVPPARLALVHIPVVAVTVFNIVEATLAAPFDPNLCSQRGEPEAICGSSSSAPPVLQNLYHVVLHPGVLFAALLSEVLGVALGVFHVL